jgi:protein TonB
MALRSLLFTSDEATAEPIRQVLAGLGVEGEYCSQAQAAIEKVTSQPFQIVIIDWDAQPEAGLLLTSARERKASERPLTLAIVSDDVSVPKALQAGANSILRKPIMVNQVKDTLTTARDLLRAKQESANAALAAAAGVSSSSANALSSLGQGNQKTLRAGEFLQSSGPIPGAQFVTESDVHKILDPSAQAVDPLKDLEPVAAAVAEQKPTPLPPPAEPRGLQWYLNSRAGTLPPVPAQASPPPPPAPKKPELLGFDQAPSYSETEPAASANSAGARSAPAAVSGHHSGHHEKQEEQEEHEQKAEAKLFAYIAGEGGEPEKESRPGLRLGKGTMIGALVLASCAIAAAPQAPWRPQLRAAWGHGRQTLHGWLNPQPVTTAQAPESHENFGRAGDEYKMPVTENIPDATTDPSQIHVLPVLDPTAKKPNNGGTNPDPTLGQDPGGTNPPDAAQPEGPQVQQNPAPGNPAQANPVQQNQVPASQPVQTSPETQPASQPAAGGSVPTPASTPAASAAEPPRPDPFRVVAPPAATQPAPPKNPQPHNASTPAKVPSSLKSQMASMTPDAGGNKPPEAAMQSIEPVKVPEAAERALLTDQPAIDFPANAHGQQGTVVLQVLIGRDGTVQEAKFLQGSLAFARTAIDGVKQWKFKPYSMNGRAVSIQTTITMSFKPTP